MKISPKGLALICEFEGFRSRAYRDPVGVWTIGYGTIKGVKPGDTITEPEAMERLRSELGEFERAVMRATGGNATQPQFDALVSFAYNVGIPGMAGSTVVKRHRDGNYQAAARAFGLWNKGRVNGKLVELPGLTRRRAAEAALYLTPTRQQNFVGLDDMAYEVEPERSMAHSEINRAGVVAGGTAAATAAAEVARSVGDVKDGIASLGDWLLPIALLVIVGLVGYMVWQRFTQRREGWA